MIFRNRREAGQLLAQRLIQYRDEHPIVLGMPRGGVEVAYEVARQLGAPLDIIVARKLGAPRQLELAIGAVVDGDHPTAVLNQDMIEALGVSRGYLDAIVTQELAEIGRRERAYRGGEPALTIEGATVILVDDGIATGATVKAAIRGLRRKGIGRLILAAPVASRESAQELRPEVDDIVCLSIPEDFMAVGAHYEDFGQTEDETVIELLRDNRAQRRDGRD